jgi:class 3 adenylate cyclase
MASLYACDNRQRESLKDLKRTQGYCIFIDMVESVSMKEQGIAAWCDTMYNLISTAMAWLSGLDEEAGNVESDNPFVQPNGLPPLKIIGDCLMFFIPARSVPRGANTLNIFDALLNVVREPKGFGSDVRPEVRVAVTWCEDTYEVTFVKGIEDVHGKDIDLAARLVKEEGPQELVMNEAFYLRAECDFLNWRSAGNVRKPEDGYEQFANVQGPWTKRLKGFRQPLNIYKWSDLRLR